jgi:hypothetical protein
MELVQLVGGRRGSDLRLAHHHPVACAFEDPDEPEPEGLERSVPLLSQRVWATATT